MRVPSNPASAFTLIELLVVITIILILSAVGIPVMRYASTSAQIHATRALVRQIDQAVATYGVQAWTYTGPSGQLITHTPMWDLPTTMGNPPVGDGFIDAATDNFPAWALGGRGYRGFLQETGLMVPKRFVNGQQQLVDAWGSRLLIKSSYLNSANDPNPLPNGLGIGVWSAGPNRLTWNPNINTFADTAEINGSTDDIWSWK